MTNHKANNTAEQAHYIPRFSIHEVRILEFMDELSNATPTLSQIAEKVYGDSGKKGAVHYHVQALRECGTISDAPILKGRIALTDREKTRKQVERDRRFYSREEE